jgi:putative transposase
MFTTDASRRLFESTLERMRNNFRVRVYAYVVMPEHIHLLVSEPEHVKLDEGAPFKACPEPVEGPALGLGGDVCSLSHPMPYRLADALKSLKQSVSRQLITRDHFWQKRYYDFNIRNHSQFLEKIRYIHRNPVKRGLCERPEDWEWSSFRHYATGCEGRVTIESEWAARKRERAEGRLPPAVELPHSSQNRA